MERGDPGRWDVASRPSELEDPYGANGGRVAPMGAGARRHRRVWAHSGGAGNASGHLDEGGSCEWRDVLWSGIPPDYVEMWLSPVRSKLGPDAVRRVAAM